MQPGQTQIPNQPPVYGVPTQQPGVPAQPATTPVPQPNIKQNTTQNTLRIAEIRDGLVIMQDGSYRAIVMAQSINFDLMSPEEREAVESSYQGFLNSLYFPIQIQIRSFRVDLKNYMQKLERLHDDQDNVLLSLLIEDYIAYVEYLTESSNIMDKQFFVVIPYYATPEGVKAGADKSKRQLGSLFGNKKGVIHINEAEFKKTKLEMKQRVTAVLESMNQMGVQAVALNTQEMIELFYNAYNPDTATVQQLANFSDLDADLIEKGTGDAPRPSLSEV